MMEAVALLDDELKQKTDGLLKGVGRVKKPRYYDSTEVAIWIKQTLLFIYGAIQLSGTFNA